MQFRTVSQHLIKPPIDGKLVVKLSVPLQDMKGIDSFYAITEVERNKYLTMNVDTSLVFQYKDNTSYDPNKTIKVGLKDIFKLKRWMNEYYTRVLTRSDLFTYYKSGNITCNARRDDTKTLSLIGGGFISLEPSVIVDEHNSIYPGVNLMLNMTDYKVNVTIDEFELLMYVINGIDLNRDGMNLIVARLLMEERSNRINRSTNINQTEISKYETPKEVVQDNRVISNKPKSIFDL